MRISTHCSPVVAATCVVAVVGLLLGGAAGLLSTSGSAPGYSSGTSTHPAPISTDASSRRTSLVPPSAGPSPPAASGLTSEGQSPAAVGLSWVDETSGTFTNYTVRVATRASDWAYSTSTVITSADTTTYVATGLSPGTDYSWEIQENYESCVLVLCTPESVLTNSVNLTQPAVAYLDATSVTSTSATLGWTDNATYGSLIAFVSYTVWEELNGGAATELTSITDQSTQSYIASLASGESYSFYVETSDCVGDCGGSDQAVSVTQSNLITLGTPLTLSASLFAEHTTIDLGQSDQFTCTPTGGESPFSYSWDFGNGTYVAGNATESVTLATMGLLTVTCKITDSEPSEAAQSVQVQVNPPLKVTVSKNRTGADVGQSVGFVCTVTNGTTPYSIEWEFGDSSTSSMNVTSHAYATAGNYAPACVVGDGAGSEAAPSLSIVISPALEASAAASSLTAAPGTELTFTATPGGGSGTYTQYNWTFGPGASASGAQVLHAFSAGQDSAIVVAVTDSNGATAEGSVTVDVSPIVVTTTPVPGAVTTGQKLTFKAEATGGAGAPYNYTWNLGNGHLGYGAELSYAYQGTGKMTPTLTVTDRLGATNVTALPAITVAAPPSPFAWFTWWVALAIVLVLAAVIVVLVVARRRREESRRLQQTASPFVPPTNPKQTIFGSKICAFCGGSNLPIRTTCRACGKPLPRSPSS